MNKILITIILIIPVFLTASMQLEYGISEKNTVKEIQEMKSILKRTGNPRVGYLPVNVLIPFEEDVVSLQVRLLGKYLIDDNCDLEPVQEEFPISSDNYVVTKRNREIYNRNKYYPYNNFKKHPIQRYKGFAVFPISLYPYKYNPVNKELIGYKKAEIIIETKKNNESKILRNEFLVTDSESVSEISEMVINPSTVSTYHKMNNNLNSRGLADENNPYSMVIITDTEREPYFDDFIDWKEQNEITTGLFLISDIYAEYDGNDSAEKLRNFIIDAYTTYSNTETPLEYVLLGGDDEIIPIRGCWGNVGSYVDNNIPCDMYYSALDGNWNENNNDLYGEPDDNPDLLPELAVGRIPAESEIEFSNFFYKTMFYGENPSFSDGLAYMFGESLDAETWGGDSKDNIIPYFSENFHLKTLYQRDGDFGVSAVKEVINFGLGVINHLGHSNENMVFGVNPSIVANFTNTEFGFAYTQGCYPAAFDETTSQAQEAVAEHLVFAEGGLHSFIGNTRYGWYSPGNTNGASQLFDLAFFEAVFTNGYRKLGQALTQSKITMMPQVLESSVLRWVDYELVLFGDPSLELKEPSTDFPLIKPIDMTLEDTNGDNDGNINPGENVDFYFTLQNQVEWAEASEVTATLSFENEEVQIINNNISYGGILPGQDETNQIPFSAALPQDIGYSEVNFTLTVEAVGNEGMTFQKDYDFSFEVNLIQNNWPWYTDNNINSAPFVYDFNQDGSKDIVVIDKFGNINLLNDEAQQIDGYPLENNLNIWRSTAIGKIDDDNAADMVMASRNGKIIAINNQGDYIFEFECGQQLLTPMINDLNDDDINEVISLGIDKKLHVLDNEGNELDGFPQTLSSLSSSEMATADIDEDGFGEIVVGTMDNMLYVYEHDGTIKQNFPLDLGASISGGIVIADTGDLIVGLQDNRVIMLDDSADIIFEKMIEGRIGNSPVLANIKGDSDLEIIFNTFNGYIYAIDQEGNDIDGFPLEFDTQFTLPPLIADINDDSVQDILCTTYRSDLYAINSFGELLGFSPVGISLIAKAPASISDIDEDGDLDLVSGLDNGIMVLDIKTEAGEAIWDCYRGSRKRTGFYGDTPYVKTTDNELLPATKLFQNYPNPLFLLDGKTSKTNISFSLSKRKGVSLKIYNLKGQKVKTIVDEVVDKGKHTFSWNAEDKYGKKVGTGVYFYQLDSGVRTKTKKMIILK